MPYLLWVSRNRTPLECVGHALYLYFSGLSLRAPERLSCFVRRNHVSIWNDSKHKPTRAFSRRKKISEFVIGETLIKVGPESAWLWVAMEPKNKETPALTIFKERNMLVAERFISGLVRAHEKHPVSTDGGTWHPQACRFLEPRHLTHSPFEKSPVERTIQYIKNRTECFDDYFPCRLKNCRLGHVGNWLRFFADCHNTELYVVNEQSQLQMKYF